MNPTPSNAFLKINTGTHSAEIHTILLTSDHKDALEIQQQFEALVAIRPSNSA
jgi:hypothetical protein